MKVNLRTSMAGPNGSFEPGIHEFADDFAQSLIAGGFATELLPGIEKPKPAPERAPEAASAVNQEVESDSRPSDDAEQPVEEPRPQQGSGRRFGKGR